MTVAWAHAGHGTAGSAGGFGSCCFGEVEPSPAEERVFELEKDREWQADPGVAS